MYPLAVLPNVNIPAIYANETDTGSEAAAYWSDTYVKPWCRIGVYFIGMLTGYILYVTNNKLKMRKVRRDFIMLKSQKFPCDVKISTQFTIQNL